MMITIDGVEELAVSIAKFVTLESLLSEKEAQANKAAREDLEKALESQNLAKPIRKWFDRNYLKAHSLVETHRKRVSSTYGEIVAKAHIKNCDLRTMGEPGYGKEILIVEDRTDRSKFVTFLFVAEVSGTSIYNKIFDNELNF